jgi:hypothetical protein
MFPCILLNIHNIKIPSQGEGEGQGEDGMDL